MKRSSEKGRANFMGCPEKLRGHLGEALGGVIEGHWACSSAPSVGGRDQRLERVIQEALEEKDSLSLDDSGSATATGM